MAKAKTRTPTEWRKTLRLELQELDRYLTENVETDDLHKSMLRLGLDSADKALNEEDFWPGYLEGITRLALLLMGDYPDHRGRKPGRKKSEHPAGIFKEVWGHLAIQ